MVKGTMGEGQMSHDTDAFGGGGIQLENMADPYHFRSLITCLCDRTCNYGSQPTMSWNNTFKLVKYSLHAYLQILSPH
jgi:hypothetical protein